MGRNAGSRGACVISWAQTEIDSIRAAPFAALAIGAQWRWWGKATGIDRHDEILTLQDPLGASHLHEHAALAAARVLRGVGLMPENAPKRAAAADPAGDDTGAPQGFVVTDGVNNYPLTAVRADTGDLLVLFDGCMPPMDVDLFVIEHSGDREAIAASSGQAPGVICFTPGTTLETPEGPRLIEDIRAGDRICTKDDGAQEVLWTGQRRMTGARLYAMPHLRPIRIRAGAMGEDRPDRDLIVSPEHRMLVKTPSAMSLFNQPEVLVAARDLVDGHLIVTETGIREVSYIHVMTERHQIVWANGLETESFHPANACLDMIDAAQRANLLDLMPEIAEDPYRYGGYARRNLTTPEAAILQYQAA
ncbi:MAG: Hint domain-containing protein [Rhodobacteraceae bacterium]|nr:Hint domain-containing protein [Paracoccaceae bacterium]MCP5342048.1 Hint domain-containing protein [Paracoccaceae bacterium]